MNKPLSVLLLALLTHHTLGGLIAPCAAKVITVDDNGPADYRTIQEAINKSWAGDTIVVKPGTYNETVVFNGRAVTLTSLDPNDPAVVQSTVITGRTDYSVVFDFGEGTDSLLTGFTITTRGIRCVGASPTITNNTIKNCSANGIAGQSNAAPVIVGNTILANKAEGIYLCDGPITGNTISDNACGIAYCKGPIRDNIIVSNRNTAYGYGGGLTHCDGEIAGNIIRGNYASLKGGGLYNCTGDIRNNIIAGNRSGQSGGGLYNCTTAIFNNTIVGNIAGGDGGALAACPGQVFNNVIASNKAVSAGAIHGPCLSSYNGFWANTPDNFAGGAGPGPGDIVVDPFFAVDGYWDNNGTIDQTDDFWVQGDYHLKSQRGRWNPAARKWVADEVTSYCIDAGSPVSDWTDELWPHGKRINMGAYGGTAEASMSSLDLGNIADLNYDDSVDHKDLTILMDKWLDQSLLLPADLNRNGIVDSIDFAVFAANWLSRPRPPTPPIPNPMTWAVKPYATSPYSIAMVAATAVSTDGSGIEYYFEDYFNPQYNSGWLSFAPGQQPKWEDTNLTPETVYWYRVKARNKANRLETLWADRFFAVTPQEDKTAPTPNPAAWHTQPYVSGQGSIKMVAATAADPSGVEYQFECISHPAYTSLWQDSSTYELKSLPKGTYTFVTRSRDKSSNHNTTGNSIPVTVDLQPPTPDPMKWKVAPDEVNIGGGTFDYYATMTAEQATDESGAVEYYFQCTTQPGFNSAWQTSTTYTVKVGRSGQAQRFHVKARDANGNETAWSPELPAN